MSSAIGPGTAGLVAGDRRCRVCTSPDRAVFDELLEAGVRISETMRALRSAGISVPPRSSISRHRARHLTPAARERQHALDQVAASTGTRPPLTPADVDNLLAARAAQDALLTGSTAAMSAYVRLRDNQRKEAALQAARADTTIRQYADVLFLVLEEARGIMTREQWETMMSALRSAPQIQQMRAESRDKTASPGRTAPGWPPDSGHARS